VYTVILDAHGLLRWIVLVAAAWALFRAYRGWLTSTPWVGADRRAGLVFSSVLDLQVLMGVALAFVSPLIQNALFGLKAAMDAPHLRFFLVEHIPLMLVALVLVHAGSGTARRATDARLKHQRAALMYTLATLAMIVAIPWWRPILPGLI
jgi:cytochrome c biogenesis factor